ncbi:MAG TPA: biotin/lipoyl-binding protein [Methylomirabilota bacterium]|nr:biotin/lipoyl-binding protein [Methylomirabilota bacterium]
MKNQSLLLASGLVLLLAGISIVRTQPRMEEHAPPVAPPQADFEQRVAAVGLVEPRSEIISLASHLPGVVEKVFVTVGQEVRAGDPLVKLDTRALEAQRAERKAELATREAAVATAEARARIARASLADVQRHLRFAESVSDPRSISAEELTRRRGAVEIAEAELAAAEAEVAASRAAVTAAQAALRAVVTDLERSTVTAPIDSRVLQVRIRAGEFAPAGPSASPWLVLGDVSTLHVRVDIDEHEAWRVRPGTRAIAQVRGNARLRADARFVRFEPVVVPKQSLTGASTERVDTRVLQAIYRLEGELPVFVGQQMDVFIDASDLKTAQLQEGGRP